MSVYSYSHLTYDLNHRAYEYPPYAIAIGWFMAISSIIMIPITMVWKVLREQGPILHVSIGAINAHSK